MADDTEFSRRFRGLRRSLYGVKDTNLPVEEGTPAMKRKKQREGAERAAVGHLRDLSQGKLKFGAKK